jgi:hypothetical protein
MTLKFREKFMGKYEMLKQKTIPFSLIKFFKEGLKLVV